ncbi:MAG: hypothetical protein Q4A84_08350 [Neisseria sp.]|uniref:hypothetical protein n=1 Tax=Neisseria sp. TaxID=192066 RepID=UPI0026DD145E|nr:hypothetical protein [Neisseria sp.]MDO4641689.1 hypothetical protein [Neisseria sp.]
MKVSHLILIISLAGTVCACSNEEEKQLARQQIARERITILEQAKNSTDPYIQQQAKLVREQIQAEEEKQRADKEKVERDKILNPILAFMYLVVSIILVRLIIWIKTRE